MKQVLVTGGAGFIGSHVAESLLRSGSSVVVLDNLNDYYSPPRKRANIEEVRASAKRPDAFYSIDGDVRDRMLLQRLFREFTFDSVIHLAAMAGVRASIDDPE